MSEIWTKGPDVFDEWEPAVPLPLFIQSWFGLRKRYGCVCRAEFRTQSDYEAHYRGWHIHHGGVESD